MAPCYTRGEEVWCAFLESEQEVERYCPTGYEFFGTAASSQSVFVPVRVADQRKQQIFKVKDEEPPKTLKQTIEELIHESLPKSELEVRIPLVAKEFKYQSQEIWRLYQTKEQEIEDAEARDDRAAGIHKLLQIGSHELRLSDYLRNDLAKPLETIANHIGSTGAAMLTTLLPTAASLLKIGTQLELIKSTGFYALPILYTGIVAESGGSKSPTQKTILKPLFRMQAEAEEMHKLDLRDWEAEAKAARNSDETPPEKPNIREYYCTNSTQEAIFMIQAQQPDRGFLGWFDELSAQGKMQNQYRNGKGSDKESLLSGRDGTGGKINRASGKRFSIETSGYSITGGTQPDTLRHMIGDISDPSGEWARILWTVLPLKPAPFPEDDANHDISELLYAVYRRLESFEATTYRMSVEARALYAQWFNQLDGLRMSEAKQGSRSVFSKMKGDTGVLALLLHCINAAIDGRQPANEVSIETMKAAIRLSKYYLSQVQLIHAEGGSNDEVEPEQVYTKLIRLSERKGWLKAKDVKNFDRLFKKTSPEQVRAYFRELEIMGLGSTKGSGRHLEWKASERATTEFSSPHDEKRQTKANGDTKVDHSVDAKTPINQGFKPNGDKKDSNNKNDHHPSNGHSFKSEQNKSVSYLSTQTPTNGQKPSTTTASGDQHVSTERHASAVYRPEERLLEVGDRVKYVGNDRGLLQVWNGKKLTIVEINGDTVRAKFDGAAVCQSCPLEDLRRMQ